MSDPLLEDIIYLESFTQSYLDEGENNGNEVEIEYEIPNDLKQQEFFSSGSGNFVEYKRQSSAKSRFKPPISLQTIIDCNEIFVPSPSEIIKHQEIPYEDSICFYLPFSPSRRSVDVIDPNIISHGIQSSSHKENLATNIPHEGYFLGLEEYLDSDLDAQILNSIPVGFSETTSDAAIEEYSPKEESSFVPAKTARYSDQELRDYEMHKYDYICGVSTFRSTACKRNLSCKTHSLSEKLLVPRSKPFEVLSLEEKTHQKETSLKRRHYKRLAKTQQKSFVGGIAYLPPTGTTCETSNGPFAFDSEISGVYFEDIIRHLPVDTISSYYRSTDLQSQIIDPETFMKSLSYDEGNTKCFNKGKHQMAAKKRKTAKGHTSSRYLRYASYVETKSRPSSTSDYEPCDIESEDDKTINSWLTEDTAMSKIKTRKILNFFQRFTKSRQNRE